MSQDEATESKLKACSTPELLERMPLAHKLLSRLIACIPQGSAAGNEIVVQACGLVGLPSCLPRRSFDLHSPPP